jgi:hypothetical protein
MTRSYSLFLLACLLAACQDPPKLEKTFSIRLEPSILNLRVTETGNVKITLNRVGGFAEAVTVTLGGEAVGLTATALTIPGGATEGTLSFVAGDTAKIGTSFPTINAASGQTTKTETLTLRVAKAVAEATTVTLKGNGGSSQLRQGSGTITLEIDGKNLERISAVKLGDLAVSVLPGRTSTRLELQTTIGHGASLGAKDLVLTADGGDTTRPGVLTVTPITSGPSGNDTTGAGTTEHPYRTLKNVLSIAQSGDVVRLLNGTYNAAGGESWPTITSGALTPNVPVGVRVEGESTAGTVLEGPGAATTTVGLAFAGAGGVASLTVKSFVSGLFVMNGTIAINSVVAQADGFGLTVGGGSVTVVGSEFKANSFGVMVVGASSSLDISASSSHHNTQDGLRVGDGAPTLHAVDFEAYNNASGLGAAGQAKVTLERVKLHDNRDSGLKATEQAEVKTTGGELYANAQAGLWFSGKNLVVRTTTIRENAEFGVYVEGNPAKVDFGNFTEPGQNDLHGNGPNGNADQILDVRSDRATLGDPETFTLSATKLNGTIPAADVYPGDGKWPYLNSPYFSVLGKNNVIRIY